MTAEAVDLPFLMPIENVTALAERGTLVTGRIENGILTIGSTLEIVRSRDALIVTCIGIEAGSP
ncbi:hypothetical protein [Nocardia tengchongensis]|uniref:hypothetical protein n=1 Tax=Nocardia tengchongensis TaxID=2055889 RepID=UPI0036CEC0B5